MYSLPDNAWADELTALVGTSSARAEVAALIPDATPGDAPFTLSSAELAVASLVGGDLPWLMLVRFLRMVERSGDIMVDGPDEPVIGDLTLSLNAWRFAERAFEVNSFHVSEYDCWCYELYEVDVGSTENKYIDVRLPDLQPAGGPFVPLPPSKSCSMCTAL